MNRILKQTTAGALGLALTIPVTLALGTAAQAVGSGNYSCTAPIVGAQNTPVIYDSNLPDRLYVGGPDVPLTIESQGTVSASTMDQAYNLFGARYVQGTTTMPFLFDAKTYTITHKGTNTPIVKGQDTILRSTIPNAITVKVPSTTGVYPIKLAKAYTSQNKLWKDQAATQQAYDPGKSDCSRSEDLQFDVTEVWSKATTVLTGPTGPVTAGAPIQVTAKVTAPGATPAGSVTFTVGEQTVTATVNAAGVATATLPGQPGGAVSVSAVHAPTGARVEAAPIAPLDLTVAAAATTTSVVLDPATVVEGSTSTARVQVSSAAGKPSGTVQVQVNGQSIDGTVTDGVAEIALPVLPLGLHDVTATFTPANAGFFTGSVAAPVQLKVHEPARATATTLTLDKTSGTAGDAVRATVAVTAVGATPVGTARVAIGGRQVSAQLDENGKAVLELPALPAGVHEVSASFTPSDPEAFAASQAPDPVTLTLTAPTDVGTTATDLTLVNDTVRAGTPAVVRVFVSSTRGIATGRVAVTVDGTTTTADVVKGKAEVTVAPLAPGKHLVSAAFTPIGAFAPSQTDSPAELTVTRAPSTTLLSLTPATVSEGTAVQAAVSVDSVVGAERIAGTVTVTVNGRPTTAPVSAGKATLDLGTLPVGTHVVGASFERTDASWASNSTATSRQVVVTRAPVTEPAAATTTTLALTPASVLQGERAQVVATVAGPVAPQGSVEFTVNARTISVPVSAGRAALSLPQLPLGQHRITAAFVPADVAVALPSTASAVTLTVRAQEAAPATPTSTRVSVPASAVVTSTFVVSARVTGATNGSVVFTAGGSPVTVPVVQGVATARLVAAEVGRLGVSARYVPTNPAAEAASVGTATVTVTKRSSRTTARAKVRKAAKQVVLSSRSTPVDAFCSGTVSYQVRRGATVVARATAPVRCSGVATATVKLPRKKGRYVVTARFSGSASVLGSTATARFKR